MNVMDKRATPTIKSLVREDRGLRLRPGPIRPRPAPLCRFCWRLCARFPSLLEGSAPEKGKSFLKASIQKP